MEGQSMCWHNGTLQPAQEATVSVLDHGLLYGDGVFEGLRFYRGQPFRLASHLQRLQRSLAALGITLRYSVAQLQSAVEETVKASGLGDGYLRILVTRGVGPLGLDPQRCDRPNVFIIADQLELVAASAREQGIRVISSSIRRAVDTGLDPRIKSLNYLHSILARMEATRAGADEAILLNNQGRLAEGSAENLFLVQDNCLLTPPCHDGALAGITRGIVLELAQALGLAWAERSLTQYDLYTADECFLTGSGARLIPVREADGRGLRQCPGPVYQQVQQAFAELIRRECP